MLTCLPAVMLAQNMCDYVAQLLLLVPPTPQRSMTALNVGTGKTRAIRLKLDVPPTWTTPVPELIQQPVETYAKYVEETDNTKDATK